MKIAEIKKNHHILKNIIIYRHDYESAPASLLRNFRTCVGDPLLTLYKITNIL